MPSWKHLAFAAILAATTLSANACKVVESQHHVKFEPGETSLTGNEIRRFAEWRIGTRKYFFSGFRVYLTVLEGGSITHEMAMTRVAQVRMLLLNSGLSPEDIEDVETRSTQRAPVFLGPHFVQIDVDAKCPNYCCSLEPLPDNIAR
ncbi:hypothetical protein [Cupriavidus campinensis]